MRPCRVNTVLVLFQALEDPLQLKRLQLVIDGHVDDNGTQFEGLLGNTESCSPQQNITGQATR